MCQDYSEVTEGDRGRNAVKHREAKMGKRENAERHLGSLGGISFFGNHDNDIEQIYNNVIARFSFPLILILSFFLPSPVRLLYSPGNRNHDSEHYYGIIINSETHLRIRNLLQ